MLGNLEHTKLRYSVLKLPYVGYSFDNLTGSNWYTYPGMGSLNQATSATVSLVPTAFMVVVGSLLATIVTEVARDNIYDVDIDGGDAIYPTAVVMVLMVIAKGNYTVQMVSIGMMSSAVTTLANQWGLV